MVVPGARFGIRHKNSFFDGITRDEIRELKREQEAKRLYPIVAQPKYESVVRHGPSRWGSRHIRATGPCRCVALAAPTFDTSR